MKNLDSILAIVEKAHKSNQVKKIRLTGLRPQSEPELKEIIIRPVLIKEVLSLQFVYRYKTKDLTKNLGIDEALVQINHRLRKDFYFLSLVTMEKIYQLDQKKDRITTSKNQENKKVSLEHNRQKQTYIPVDTEILSRLGVTSKSGNLLKGKESKYRQINKFIELLQPHLNNLKLTQPYNLVDMGCGKGYLTFALFYFLSQELKHQVKMTGVDLRVDLVDKCNLLSKQVNFEELTFEENSIQEHTGDMDVLIALHACDTATDDVLIKGIKSEAQLIVCSPCCHKQVRKAMNLPSDLSGISNYGILIERQAELLTDSIRTLILNHYGYKTKLVEFIDSEHTPKNLLLIAERKQTRKKDSKYLQRVAQLKSTFGLSHHYLEKILKEKTFS